MSRSSTKDKKKHRRRRHRATEDTPSPAPTSRPPKPPADNLRQKVLRLLEGTLQFLVVLLPALFVLPWATKVISAWITIGMSWFAMTIILVKHVPKRVTVVASPVLLCLAVFGASQVKPEPSYTGRITAPKTEGDYPRIEIGQSGTILTYTGPKERDMLAFFRKNGLKIELVDGRTYVSTLVRDTEGNPLVKIVRNEWKITEEVGVWDRNYSNDAIEVVDRHDRVIFQMVSLEDRIQLQGEWCADPENYSKTSGGMVVKCVRLVDPRLNGAGGLIVLIPPNPSADYDEQTEIRRIFRYHGDLHLGEKVAPDPAWWQSWLQ